MTAPFITQFRSLAVKRPLLLQIIALFALNLFFTFWVIRSTPAGQTYDEIIYLSEARSILKYGTDLTGTWRPWFLAPSDGWYSELTSTTWLPGFALFPNDPLLASRFVSGLLGSMLPILFGLLAVRLFREEKFFMPVSLVLTFNPWVFQFSRMSFDSLPSVVLYTLGLLVLLGLPKWYKLLSVPVFFWGFFQYQGHKPMLLPIAALVAGFLLLESWLLFTRENKLTVKSKKFSRVFHQIKKIFSQNAPALFVLLFTLVLTGSYLYRMPSLTSSVRSENFSVFEEEALASQVNERRRLSLDSPFTSLFENKLVEKSKVVLASFFVSFNPYTLFLEGDASVDLYAVLDYGLLHWLDLLLISAFLACVLPVKKYRLGAVFIVGLILAGALPNVLRSGNIWITFRGAFAILGLSLAAGVALARLMEINKSWLKWGLLVVYLLGALPFLHLYFFRYPVQQTRYEGFYYRVAASYLQRLSQPYVIIPDRSDALLDYLVVYNNLLAQEDRATIQTAKLTKDIKFLSDGKILPNCPNLWPSLEQNAVVLMDYRRDPCSISDAARIDILGGGDETSSEQLSQTQADLNTIEMLSVVDSGTRFRIYNDKLCAAYDLPEYPNVKTNVFAVEQLSDEVFCTTFFARR